MGYDRREQKGLGLNWEGQPTDCRRFVSLISEVLDILALSIRCE